MNVLYPVIPRGRLLAILRLAALGAAVAAVYGAVHDQVSYTISPEYFTKLKFEQFAYADLGAPPRVFVAEVGALATWWVGAIAGWSLGRVGFANPERVARREVARAFAIMLAVAAIVGAVGAGVGALVARSGVSGWNSWRDALGLTDVPAFVVVAYLHWASYIGGCLGLVIAVLDARRRNRAGVSILRGSHLT